MDNTWNIVDKGTTKLVWKDLGEVVDYQEISQLENELNTDAYYCNTTKSVVFETDSLLEVPKNVNYSELELTSRYINKDTKFNELLQQI